MTTPTAPEAVRGLRKARRLRYLWQVPTFFTGLIAVALVSAGLATPHPSPARQLHRDLRALRGGLKQARAAVDHLVTLTEKVLAASENHPERRAEAQLLAGILRARQADRADDARAAALRKQARQHLELAETAGVPAAELPRLRYYQAKLLYLSGEAARAQEELARWVQAGADDKAEGYSMLVQLHLRAEPPNLDEALKANLKVLETSDDEGALASARLHRAELLLKKGQRKDALRFLQQISATAPREVRLRGLHLQAELAQQHGLWAQAAALWKELLADPSAVPGGKARVLYCLGVCSASMEPRDEPTAARAWSEAAALGGLEGQASALKLAELHLGGKEPGLAVEALRRALGKVSTAKDYNNTLVSLEQTRELFEAAARVYQEAGEHRRARDLALLYRRIALPGMAEERLAEACEALGRSLLKGPHADEGRALLAEAAAAYEQSASGRQPNEQAPRLWRAADCYLVARDHPRAAAALAHVVQLEPAAERKVEAWFALAGTHRVLKQTEEARKAYYKCIEYPNSHITYKARFELADVELEQGHLEHAEEILLQNLTVTGPPPDRQAEEQSLYRLADLALQQRKFDRAKYWLEKILLQFPGSANELAVRDRLGECYRRLADQLRLTGEEPGTAQKQLEYQRMHREYLEAARDAFQTLADELERRAQGSPLAPTEDALLRKALFVTADCLFELPSYLPEALRRYKQLAERFRGRVEGLMACKRLWHCCSLASATNEPELTRQALETTRAAIAQAKGDLAGMSDEAFQSGPDRWTRTEWQQWLSDIGQRLGLMPVQESPAPNPGQVSPPAEPRGVEPSPALPAPPRL